MADKIYQMRHELPPFEDIQYINGLDVSNGHNDIDATAAIIVYEYNTFFRQFTTQKTVYINTYKFQMTVA